MIKEQTAATKTLPLLCLIKYRASPSEIKLFANGNHDKYYFCDICSILCLQGTKTIDFICNYSTTAYCSFVKNYV
jgi:hypothetical protein